MCIEHKYSYLLTYLLIGPSLVRLVRSLLFSLYTLLNIVCVWFPVVYILVSVVHGEIGCSKWKKTLAYLLVLPGSRARVVRCGGRYDPQLVKRSSE